MTFTFASLFSGGGGADLGLMAAGGRPLWAVEYDPAIAGVYRQNIGDHVVIGDVRAVDYSALPAVDWLHASPVCTRASVANSGASETDEDRETARAVVRAVRAGAPAVVSIENVWSYRKFDSFGIILQALGELGYMFDFSHVNAADLGVPQTRRRLILRAVRGLMPPLPAPVPWVSWYKAIEDLIPSLPDSDLAPWQAARLPAELRTVFFGNNANNTSEAPSFVEADDPVMTITTKYLGRSRAVLVNSKDKNQQWGKLYRDQTEPGFTVLTDDRQSHRPRAVLVEGNNDRNQTGVPTMRADDRPAFTVAGAKAKHRAILDDSPGVRVVAMTARALARFQSFPDSFVIPAGSVLASRVIGNAVPPLLTQRIAEGLLAAGAIHGGAA